MASINQEIQQLDQWIERIERGDVIDTAVAVADAIAIYKTAATIGDRLGDIQKRAKLIISDVMAETGETRWPTDIGTAYVPRPSFVVRYDAGALDALCASDPALAARLRPHRKEAMRAGSLTIR